MIVPDLIKAVKAGQTKAKVEIQEKCFMNKRLQELYLVASEQFKIVQDQGLPAPYQTRAFAEKFAELIVEECINVCKSRVGNSDYNTGRLHCVSDIRERFEFGMTTEEKRL